MSTIGRNIAANYISQIYITLFGIVVVPFYVRYVGVEAYGLIGFFAMFQAWFLLLDVGLTPTMARETARFNGGAGDAMSLRRLLRVLEWTFFGMAILSGVVILIVAPVIAGHWLKVQRLSLREVQHSIQLMVAIVALRWMSGLYRGVITGFEHMVWLGTFSMTIATIRFGLVIPYFIHVGAEPVDYFIYQLAVALIEFAILFAQTYRLLPPLEPGARFAWSLAPLRGVLKFSISMAFLTIVWVMVTQSDKLVLSKLLPLSDYAYYTLAVAVAGGVMMASGPISGPLLPRLTKLHAAGAEVDLIRLYRNATQIVAVVAIPAALVMAFFPEQLLWAWTGDMKISLAAAPILQLYAIGNGLLALGAFPYYLQFAKGDLKLHLIGNVLFVLVLIPILVWATWRHGVIGAGYAWLGTNLVYFIFWVPRVHRRFLKGQHGQWLSDCVVVACLPTTIAFLMHRFVTWPVGRISVTVGVAASGIVFLVVAAAASNFVRGKIKRMWNLRAA